MRLSGVKMKEPTAPNLLQVGCLSLPHTCTLELRIASVRLVQGWLPLTQAVFLPAIQVGHHPSFCTYFPLQKKSLVCLKPPLPGPREGCGSEERMLSQQIFLMVPGRMKQVEALLQGSEGLIPKHLFAYNPGSSSRQRGIMPSPLLSSSEAAQLRCISTPLFPCILVIPAPLKYYES